MRILIFFFSSNNSCSRPRNSFFRQISRQIEGRNRMLTNFYDLFRLYNKNFVIWNLIFHKKNRQNEGSFVIYSQNINKLLRFFFAFSTKILKSKLLFSSKSKNSSNWRKCKQTCPNFFAFFTLKLDFLFYPSKNSSNWRKFRTF